MYHKIILTYFIGAIVSFAVFGLALGSPDTPDKTKQDVCEFSVEHETNSKPQGLNELNEWANNLPILKAQDDSIISHMKDLIRQQENNPLISKDTIIDHFQRILAFPLQTVCHVGKIIALQKWSHVGGATDGERYLCMDNFFKDIKSGSCVIYSFGISNDYSFEEKMGSIGCVVHAYDPTINLSPMPTKNVYFHKIGLSHFKGDMKVTVNYPKRGLSDPLPVTTLIDAINTNGDLGKEITYVKVDIESSEVKAIPQWIKSGILKHVRQIGIELHTGRSYFNRSGQAEAAKSLFKSISQLYDLGFRHISYAPNLFVDKRQDHQNQYYTFIDIVLYKPYKLIEKQIRI